MKVLVVGHGPSYKDYEFIKSFDGLILSVDVSTPDLINNDIIPDYELFGEISEGIKMIMDECLPIWPKKVRDKMTVVHRDQIITAIPNRIKMYKMKSTIYNASKYGDLTSLNNVGLYAIAFADDIIKPDEIHLIGLDYKGVDNAGNDLSESWIESAKQYLNKKTSSTSIVDHSNGNFPNYFS